jgi:hypothetical protein
VDPCATPEARPDLEISRRSRAKTAPPKSSSVNENESVETSNEDLIISDRLDFESC